MKAYTFQQYLNAGCSQMLDAMGRALHADLQGKVCDTGCAFFKNGNCAAYKKLIATPTVVK